MRIWFSFSETHAHTRVTKIVRQSVSQSQEEGISDLQLASLPSSRSLKSRGRMMTRRRDGRTRDCRSELPPGWSKSERLLLSCSSPNTHRQPRYSSSFGIRCWIASVRAFLLLLLALWSQDIRSQQRVTACTRVDSSGE